jgi:toxin ParE1/3/4
VSGYGLHPGAYDDIDAIREYIAEDNPDAADRIVTEIFESIGSLVSLPNFGYRRPGLTTRSLRFKSVREYLISCTPDKKPLWVVAVFHGRRDPGGIALILGDREQ